MTWDGNPIALVVAPCGAEVTREQHPKVPYSPEEIVDEVVAAWQAGASACHIHARETDGSPSADPEIWRAILDGVRGRCDIVTMVSTGGAVGQTLDERRVALVAGAEIAGVETGSVNFGAEVFATTVPEALSLADEAVGRGMLIEIEAFDVGHVIEAKRLQAAGKLPARLTFNLVFGAGGGIDASPQALAAMLRPLDHDDVWTVTAVGRHQRRMIALGALFGAPAVRVGLEDNIYVGPGEKAAGNAELVASARQLVEQLGRRVATCDEARRIVAGGARLAENLEKKA